MLPNIYAKLNQVKLHIQRASMRSSYQKDDIDKCIATLVFFQVPVFKYMARAVVVHALYDHIILTSLRTAY